MSAIELYLKQAKDAKGTLHKMAISNLREYMRKQPIEEIYSAINKLKDVSLIPLLWEVGLSDDLQQLSNRRMMILAGDKIKEAKNNESNRI